MKIGMHNIEHNSPASMRGSAVGGSAGKGEREKKSTKYLLSMLCPKVPTPPINRSRLSKGRHICELTFLILKS